MKSFLKFLFLLLTILLLVVYSIGISEKVQKPTFKNFPSSTYVWLGLMLLLMIYVNIKWLFLDRRKIYNQNVTSEKPIHLSIEKQPIKQYDVFLLAKDLNPIITKGMQGVILEIWDDNGYEIEFVKKDGTNYEYNGVAIFTVDKSFIGEVIWTTPM